MAVLSDQVVADELAVRQVTAAYSDAVTARDYDTFASLWAPEGVWVVPGLVETVGGEAAAAQLKALVEPNEFLMQLLHGGQVWVEGDSARARWLLQELGRTADGQGLHFAGVYQDELVRTGEGWRFAKRHFEFLYRAFADVPGKAYPYPALDW